MGTDLELTLAVVIKIVPVLLLFLFGDINLLRLLMVIPPLLVIVIAVTAIACEPEPVNTS